MYDNHSEPALCGFRDRTAVPTTLSGPDEFVILVGKEVSSGSS